MTVRVKDLKRGDRVKVVLESAVHSVHPDGFYLAVGGAGLAWCPDVLRTSIERVQEPLPTTPGSVIADNGRSRTHFLLEADGRWYGAAGIGCPADDFAALGVTVIFDAGKSE